MSEIEKKFTEQDKNETYKLYFEEFYSISKLVRHFKNKYSHLEIRTVIRKFLERKANNKY